MKNVSYFPLERNHYYYGKLLTVEDFELEQRYMNSKRRMLNRFMNGTGVVFGMNVVLIDDYTISVLPGLAIDSAGREIVIQDAITKKLSHLSGFKSFQEKEQPYLYLCVEYEEEKKEIVYQTAGTQHSEDGNEFNKYRETYKLTLTGNEPMETGLLSQMSIYENKTVIYAGNGIKISHILPKFVQAGEDFELVVEIENLLQQQDISFSYELKLHHLKYKNGTRLKVDFNEYLEQKSYKYTKSYMLTAQDIETSASAAVIDNTIKLILRTEILKEAAKGETKTLITLEGALEKAAQNYYENQMEEVTGLGSKRYLYLSKVYLIKEEDTYVIGHIENMPFGQSMWNHSLSVMHHNFLKREIKQIKSKLKSNDASVEEFKSNQTRNTSYGICKIELDQGKQRGKIYESQEIPHGLGLGDIIISLGIGQNNGEIIWGSSKVFETNAKLDLAAKIYKERGTFCIGVKLLEYAKTDQCSIYWKAEKNAIDWEGNRSSEKKIVVNPNFINVLVRESVYIYAECKNMQDKRLKWSVQEGGGIIDKYGLYTAPDKEGIYQITISSFAYSDLNEIAYVVVREKQQT